MATKAELHGRAGSQGMVEASARTVSAAPNMLPRIIWLMNSPAYQRGLERQKQEEAEAGSKL